MAEPETQFVKYVFLDIVGFSVDRSVEAQNDIVSFLNNIVKEGVAALISKSELIYIPTGDGMCIAILDPKAAFDAHLKLAVALQTRIAQKNQHTADSRRRFEIRIGLSEGVDNIVIDINGKRNVAGAAVTLAQRVMSLADERQILLSEQVFQTLRHREKYVESFRTFKATVKHQVEITVYQFVGNPAVNNDTPKAFQNRPDPIDVELDACLAKNYSTSGQVQCCANAGDSWRNALDLENYLLGSKLGGEKSGLVQKAHNEWLNFQKAEADLINALYSSWQGTMFRPMRAHAHLYVIRDRALKVRHYTELFKEFGDGDAPTIQEPPKLRKKRKNKAG